MGFACAPITDAAGVGDCFEILKQLRPTLERAAFLEQYRRLSAVGYALAVARDADAIVAVAGYRVLERIAGDKVTLVVADLVTDAKRRSSGAGRALLAWLVDEGRRRGCTELALNSHVGRHGAHRFYLREQLALSGFHFTRPL